MGMTYQLLVSTMHQTDDSIIEKMNIHSDAVIVNQSDTVALRTIERDGHRIQLYSFDEKGVGLSRNSALMRATADIIEFADDDMVFSQTYEKDVLEEFRRHPEADAILFSVESLNPDRPEPIFKNFGRVRKREALKYGCAMIAVRREKLLYHNILFSLLFGGGARYGSGEDTILLQDMLRAGLHIYKSPIKVADVKQTQSTWFFGFTEAYYLDKGALVAAALPVLCYPYAFLFAAKNKDENFSRFQMFSMYLRGIRAFKRLQKGGKNA